MACPLAVIATVIASTAAPWLRICRMIAVLVIVLPLRPTDGLWYYMQLQVICNTNASQLAVPPLPLPKPCNKVLIDADAQPRAVRNRDPARLDGKILHGEVVQHGIGAEGIFQHETARRHGRQGQA